MSPRKSSQFEEARQFCEQHLGPASARHIGREIVWNRVTTRLDQRVKLEDALLQEVHAAAQASPELAEEFTGYFALNVLGISHGRIFGPVRLLCDTEDIVQSVCCDIAPEIFRLEFTSRARFLSLLLKRVDFKISSKRRWLLAKKRREDLRQPEDSALAGKDSEALRPVDHAAQREQDALASQAFQRLSQQDQEALRAFAQGKGIDAVANELGISYEAARNRVKRARERLQKLVND